MIIDGLNRVIISEKGRSGQPLIHYASQRIDVGARIELFSQSLLWAHVDGASEDLARLRQILSFAVLALPHFGNAKVNKLYYELTLVAHDHYVARLDVTVNDTLGMRINQCLTHLLEDQNRFCCVNVDLLLQKLGQRESLEVLHRNVRARFAVHAMLNDLNDVGML